MAKGETPGTNVGTDGGIYQEQGRRGGRKENFANVKDHGRLPPTTEP
jgi:general stress protein YciG